MASTAVQNHRDHYQSGTSWVSKVLPFVDWLRQSAGFAGVGKHFAFDGAKEFEDMADTSSAVANGYEHVHTVVRICHSARSDLYSPSLEIPCDVNIGVSHRGDWKDCSFVENLSHVQEVGDKNVEDWWGK